jgi:hypothetical protein
MEKKVIIIIQEITFNRNNQSKIMRRRRSQEMLGLIAKIDWKMWVK